MAAQAPGASGQAGTTLGGSAAKRRGSSGVMASFFDLEASCCAVGLASCCAVRLASCCTVGGGVGHAISQHKLRLDLLL